jgi:hypothetical protein
MTAYSTINTHGCGWNAATSRYFPPNLKLNFMSFRQAVDLVKPVSSGVTNL